MFARYWLIPQGRESRVATSQELRVAGVSRLRCVDLGQCGRGAALVRAKEWLREPMEPASVIARNVRLCMESGNIGRWGVTREQANQLRAGMIVTVADSAGEFNCIWTPIESPHEQN